METVLIEIRGGVNVEITATSENVEFLEIDYDENDFETGNDPHKSRQPDKIRSLREIHDYITQQTGIDTGNDEPKYPNGFTSWKETFFEVVTEITRLRNIADGNPMIEKINDDQGTHGFYELAEQLTDQFERKFKGYDWDEHHDYFDQLDEFFKQVGLGDQPVVQTDITVLTPVAEHPGWRMETATKENIERNGIDSSVIELPIIAIWIKEKNYFWICELANGEFYTEAGMGATKGTFDECSNLLKEEWPVEMKG